MKVLLATFLFVILPICASSDELADRRNEVAIIQSRIELERARYQEAKAKMERSELVAKYLLPELRAREKELEKKLRLLINGESKKKSEQKTSQK